MMKTLCRSVIVLFVALSLWGCNAPEKVPEKVSDPKPLFEKGLALE